MRDRRLIATVMAALLANGCGAARRPLSRQECYNADAQLARILQPLEALRAQGCETEVEPLRADCRELQRELERLVLVCPAHEPTLMANAIIAYDDHQLAKSQQFLDQIFAQPHGYPDAAALRARIAMDEGNVQFASRFLEQQIRLVPDHAGLRETYGAALFLSDRLAEAKRELTMAAALGAPRWRIAYHLGLVEESLGHPDEARRYYAEALEGNPAWTAARSRLNGLRASDNAVGAR